MSSRAAHDKQDKPEPRAPAEIVREYGPFPAPTTWPASPTTASASGPPPAPADRLRPRQRRAHAHAGLRRRRRHRLRRQAPLPDRRVAHRQDRPRHRQGAGVDPGARQRQRLGPDLGRGQPVGGPVPRPQDPPDRPEDRRHQRTIESNRFVTGVTWVDGELWHGTWEGDESEMRRIDPQSGAVLERLEMPQRHRRQRARVRRRRPLLLRRRRQRQGPRRAAPKPAQVLALNPRNDSL
jgi:hypothetical protein